MTIKCFISTEMKDDGSLGPWMYQVKSCPGNSVEAIGSSDNLLLLADMAKEAMRDVEKHIAHRVAKRRGNESPWDHTRTERIRQAILKRNLPE